VEYGNRCSAFRWWRENANRAVDGKYVGWKYSQKFTRAWRAWTSKLRSAMRKDAHLS